MPCVMSLQTATRWERQLCRARMEHGCFDVSFSNGAAVEAPGTGLGSEVQVWAQALADTIVAGMHAGKPIM